MESDSHENPAAHVVAKCGGALVVAQWLGLKPAAVYRWTYPTARGGSNGLIPSRWQRPILTKAEAAGIDLKPIDFLGNFSSFPESIKRPSRSLSELAK